jgi:hypothetical protein
MLSSCHVVSLIVGAGKDFDFTQQGLPGFDKPPTLPLEPANEQVAAARQFHQALPKQQSPLQPQPTPAGSAGRLYTRPGCACIDHLYL